MSESVDDFLAHYGVKGMKWGRHKAKPPLTDEQRQARRQKIAKGATIAGGVLLVAGATAAAVLLSKNGATPVANIATQASTNVGHDLLTLTRSTATTAARSAGQTSFGNIKPPAGFSVPSYTNAMHTPVSGIMGNTANMMNQFNAAYRV